MSDTRPVVNLAAAGPEENANAQPSEQTLPDMPLPSEPHNVFLGGLFVLGVMAAAYVARDIFMPLAFALVLALMFQPVVRWLDRIRLPRMISALLIITVLLSAIILLGAAIAGPASAWIGRLPEGVPKLQERLSFLREPINLALSFFRQVQEFGANEPAHQSPLAVAGTDVLAAVVSGARGFIGELFTAILFLFFLLLGGDGFLRRLVEILPGFKAKRQAVDIAYQIENDITAYLATITLMNALVGVATAIIMRSLGIGDAPLWGVVAFLLNFAPIVGPAIGVSVFLLAGLLSIENTWHALMPAALYFCVHLAEGEALTPMLLAKRFTVNPLLIVVSLVFWFWMWGFSGAILSAPMLAILKIICDRVRSFAALGHLLEA